MTLVRVAVPVFKCRMLARVDKGRPWSVLEHLILEALSKKEWTAIELAKAANISKRVVIESLIRLMRAGWIDMANPDGSVMFKANAFGLAAVSRSELPSTVRRIPRFLNFIVDLVAGDVFRNRDWFLYEEAKILQKQSHERIVWIEPQVVEESFDREEFANELLDSDETFVDAQPLGVRKGFVLVDVVDDQIKGLPDRNLAELKLTIQEAAKHVSAPSENKTIFSVPGFVLRRQSTPPKMHQIEFSLTDLILDSDAHRKALEGVLQNASSNVFIHSTFISEQRVLEWLPQIKAATKRGVKVHVFWGQNDDKDEASSTRVAISKLRKNSEILALEGSLSFHPHSTTSHAKLIVADSGKNGAFIAIVGSCNWLTSGFNSYEASVALRDPKIVKEVVKHFAYLCFTHNGVWSDLATEFMKLHEYLSDAADSISVAATAAIVVGAQHNSFVLRARDEAKDSIFVASHRFGPSFGNSILAPLIAAASQNEINASVYYNRLTGPIGGKAKSKLFNKAEDEGVSIQAVEHPRLHAKILGWDNDSVLITSLNWLSASPVDNNSAQEIGIYIHMKDVAKSVTDHFTHRLRT